MAQADIFLKIDTIDGESTKEGHKGELDIESWSWGEANQGTHGSGGGGGAGKVAIQDMHFTVTYGKASPKLFLACATGQHIPKAVLTCRKAGGKQETYLTITLSGLMISSYQTGASGHGSILPMDQFSMNFSKIEIVYQAQDEKGKVGDPVKAGYDVAKGTKV